jgi:hypothetical protein
LKKKYFPFHQNTSAYRENWLKENLILTNLLEQKSKNKNENFQTKKMM